MTVHLEPRGSRRMGDSAHVKPATRETRFGHITSKVGAMCISPELQRAREAAEELLSDNGSNSLVVLPLYRTDDGMGVYAEGAIQLVHTLRDQGFTVSWADEASNRSYSAKRSIEFVLSLILAVPLGVASSAIWSGLVRLFGKEIPPTTQVELQIVREISAESVRREWLTYRGTGEEIAELMSRQTALAETIDAPPLNAVSGRRATQAVTEGADAGSALDDWERRSAERLAKGHERAVELLRGSKAALEDSREDAENDARQALSVAAETYWYAERSPQAEFHHRFLHEIGRWTRTNFECVLDFDGSQYSTSCPVKLADKRLGFSPGYVAKKFCSICDGDLSECPHRPGRMYWVTGGPTSFGVCRVCGEQECDHGPDRLYRAPVVSVVKHIDALEEVSLVDIPAQPLARLTSIPIGTADLAAALGPNFSVGMPVSCDHCLAQYHGLPERLLPGPNDE